MLLHSVSLPFLLSIPSSPLPAAEPCLNQTKGVSDAGANNLQPFLVAEGRMGVFIVWDGAGCKPIWGLFDFDLIFPAGFELKLLKKPTDLYFL